jgi:4a-hydroxytetrahydrobiopterin dehydratase
MHRSGSASLSLSVRAQRLHSLPQSPLSNVRPCRSTRLSFERWVHTKLVTTIAYRLPSRRERSFALHSPHARRWGIKTYSTSQVFSLPDTRQIEIAQMSDEIIFSADQPSDLPERASKLLSKWELTASRKGITRQYTFPSFSKAWKFMSSVTDEIKLKNHHPSWSNVYNQVSIEWTTHKPEGLSVKDVEMAEKCDRIANDIGLKA